MLEKTGREAVKMLSQQCEGLDQILQVRNVGKFSGCLSSDLVFVVNEPAVPDRGGVPKGRSMAAGS